MMKFVRDDAEKPIDAGHSINTDSIIFSLPDSVMNVIDDILDDAFLNGKRNEKSVFIESRNALDANKQKIIVAMMEYIQGMTRERYRHEVEKAVNDEKKSGRSEWTEATFQDTLGCMALYMNYRIMPYARYFDRAIIMTLVRAISSKAAKEYGEKEPEEDEHELPSPFRQYVGKDGMPWGGYNVLRNGGPFNDMMLTAGKRGRKEKTSIDGVAVDAKVYKNMPFGSERIIMPVVTGAGGQSMLTHIMGLFAARCPKDASIQQIEKARHIKVYVDDFMESCGLTYEKKAIEKMRKYFLWLQTSIIEWSGTVKDRDDKGNAKTQPYKGKDGKNHKRTIKTESRLAGAILGQVELSGKEGYTPAIFHDNDGKKYFKVSINMDFAKHNAYSPVMPYYSKLAQIDFQKFPSAIYLANRMLMHYNMNQGKQNEGILSNKILLGASNLPSYDSLARKTTRKKTNGKEVDYISKGNNWMRDIVEPLEKNLDELQRVGMICRWEFCSSNGRPLNDNAFSLFREFESAFTSFEIDKHIQ